MIYRNRSCKKRWRSGNIYIKDTFKYIERNDLTTFSEGKFESIFIEIFTPNPAIVGEIYRVPNTSIDESLNHYDSILQKLNDFKKPVIIGTDQNFDLLKTETHRKTSDFLDLFY